MYNIYSYHRDLLEVVRTLKEAEWLTKFDRCLENTTSPVSQLLYFQEERRKTETPYRGAVRVTRLSSRSSRVG